MSDQTSKINKAIDFLESKGFKVLLEDDYQQLLGDSLGTYTCDLCGACGESGCCSPSMCKCLYGHQYRKDYRELESEHEELFVKHEKIREKHQKLLNYINSLETQK